jgi:HPt (histidine-containing phosphotransfer) domain-containing protein
MNGHLSKPIDPDMLYATLAEFNARRSDVRPGPTTSTTERSVASAMEGASGLPEIMGLDIRSGLHHSGGRAQFYSELLKRFARDFTAFARTVEANLSAGDWEDAARGAHTLKGLAASLGMVEIRPRAEALEMAARTRDIVQSRNHLARTVEYLAPLVSALRLHYRMDEVGSRGLDAEAPQEGATHSAGSDPDLGAWLARFRDLLGVADVEARDAWAARPRGVDAKLAPHVVHRITLALDSFEFDAVLRLLRESPLSAGATHETAAPR